MNKKIHTRLHTGKRRTNRTKLNKTSHSYFINSCKFNNTYTLNDTYLKQYLDKLGIKQDNASRDVEKHYKEIARKNSITYKNFCTSRNKIYIPPQKIGADIFFYSTINFKINTNLYRYNKFLVNRLNIDFPNIVGKLNIYHNVKKVAPEIANKYFIPTFNINDLEKYEFPEYYIIRPVEGAGGHDIFYVNNRKDLQKAIEFYKNTTYGNNIASSKMLTDLVLFNGRKLQLRIYYILSTINGIINSFVLDNGEIMIAKDKFDTEIPFTKNKHDTHADTTTKDYTIFEHFTTKNLNVEMDKEKYKNIYNKIKLICSGITKIITKQNAELLFDKVKNGYHLFGLDILITKDLEPVLVECNETPGFETNTEEGQNNLSQMLYSWINSIILEPIFKYNNPDPLIARKHKTYISS